MGIAGTLIDLLARALFFDKTRYSSDVVHFLISIGLVLLALAVVDGAEFGAWVRRRGRPILAVACLLYLGWSAYRVACYTLTLGRYRSRRDVDDRRLVALGRARGAAVPRH